MAPTVAPTDRGITGPAAALAPGHPVGMAFLLRSPQRNPHAWDEPLAATVRLPAGPRIAGDRSVADLGGGFVAAMLDAAPFDGCDDATITSSLEWQLGDDPPELMAEPRRTMVTDAGVLETEAVLDAGFAALREVFR